MYGQAKAPTNNAQKSPTGNNSTRLTILRNQCDSNQDGQQQPAGNQSIEAKNGFPEIVGMTPPR